MEASLQMHKNMEQNGRVNATGEGNEDPVAGPDESLPFDDLYNRANQRRLLFPLHVCLVFRASRLPFHRIVVNSKDPPARGQSGASMQKPRPSLRENRKEVFTGMAGTRHRSGFGRTAEIVKKPIEVFLLMTGRAVR